MKVDIPGGQDVFAPPASYAQERLWFLEQLEPGTALYNIPYLATVRGTVRAEAFHRALNRMVARHESLRTCFTESGGHARQVVYDRLTVEPDWVDLTRDGTPIRAGRLQELCTTVTSSPFDLSRPPLFRIMVVASGAETTIITTMHHIISDGWSIGIFQRDLMALYEEELGGRPAKLPNLPIQYADFTVWQRSRLDGDGLDRLKRYWSEKLEGANTVLQVPADFDRPSKQTFNGDVHMFSIKPETLEGLKALCAEHGATLFMSLFTVFAILLHRLTGEDDLLVGTPIAGRQRNDLEDLIGLFVNTLVLRTSMQPTDTYLDLLTQVKATTIEAFEQQDMPFEKLVLQVNPKRDLSHSPLIQVLFSLQNIPALQKMMEVGAGSAPSPMASLNGHTGTAKFDLALFVSEVGGELQCAFEYNTDLYAPVTVARFGKYFTYLVEGIVRQPWAQISAYPLMSADERRVVLGISRGEEVTSDWTGGLHRLFEARCRRCPDAVAVAETVDGRRSISYADLNALSNRIGRRLLARGVGPGSKICVFMRRSIEQIACVLAAVKVGAAYVPLDPSYPLERLRYIVNDAGADLLMRSPDRVSEFDDHLDTVVIDRDAGQFADQEPENLTIDCSPEQPLYVIYTSGSTGRPKGVVMPHRSIVNLIDWHGRTLPTREGDVTLQYAPLNFDVATQEIFSTLASGGSLQVIDENTRKDPRRLLHFIHEQGVARLFVPPAAFEQLAGAVVREGTAPPKLAQVVVAGDKLRVTDDVRRWFEASPSTELVNEYGPSETHVVSWHRLAGDPAAWPVHPPIGTPIANVALYILDQHLEPVPARVVGELYIGGMALATSYLNLEDETRARFVDDPFEDRSARLYRTGDLCRRDDDGVISFVGRADQQIKLRGFRIEPGEIEVCLKRHPGVEDAVVVKRADASGDDQLVAYAVLADQGHLDRWEMRSHLSSELPAYMVPTQLVVVEGFPMTGSGKVDRRRLPAPLDSERLDPTATHVAPRTPVEEFLVEVWRDLLHVDTVSVHDNFFDLGGHSLSATQLVSRIRDRYSVEVPIYSIFEKPTLEMLAVEVVQLLASLQEEPELDALLAEVEGLSEEELDALLADM